MKVIHKMNNFIFINDKLSIMLLYAYLTPWIRKTSRGGMVTQMVEQVTEHLEVPSSIPTLDPMRPQLQIH